MPEQELPPSLSDTSNTLQPLEEDRILLTTDQRLVDFLTELGLEKYIEVRSGTTKPPYNEPLKDLVNCTVTEVMESRTQCHYSKIGLAQITWID